MGKPREYKVHAADFSFGFDKAGVKIGMASKMGDKVFDKHPKQEDAVDADVGMEDFKKLSHEDRIAVIMETFAEVQSNVESQIFRNKPTIGGATACVTFSWLEEIPGSLNMKLITYTANVGDCSTYLARAKKSDESVGFVERLNTSIDHYDERKEGDKVNWKLEDGKMRVAGCLAMSRALGNTKLNKDGLRHDPHVEYHEFVITPEEIPLLVTTCDGVTEITEQFSEPAMRKYLESLGYGQPYVLAYGDRLLNIPYPLKLTDTIFMRHLLQEALESTAEQKGQDKRLGSIAELITHWAYQASMDNISDVVIIPSKTPSYMGVYDGHGTKAVSEYCRDNFARILRERCAKKLAAEEKFGQKSHAIHSLFTTPSASEPDPEKKTPTAPKLTGGHWDDQ